MLVNRKLFDGLVMMICSRRAEHVESTVSEVSNTHDWRVDHRSAESV